MPSDSTDHDLGQDSEERPIMQSSESIVPTRSLDDSDVGWGEPVPADDDDRFRRDRPPHWDAF